MAAVDATESKALANKFGIQVRFLLITRGKQPSFVLVICDRAVDVGSCRALWLHPTSRGLRVLRSLLEYPGLGVVSFYVVLCWTHVITFRLALSFRVLSELCFVLVCVQFDGGVCACTRVWCGRDCFISLTRLDRKRIIMVHRDPQKHQTAQPPLASPQGFPTIKVFGADKRSPTDYKGERTATAIVTGGMAAARDLVKSRQSGGAKKPSKDKKGEASGSKSKPDSG